MTDQFEDDAVIARLRSALNEVTAESHGLTRSDSPRSSFGLGRWMAVAAASVLIVGAVAAVVINRRHTVDTAADTESTTPTPPTDPTTTLADSVDGPWYILISPDLVAEPVEVETCCVPFPTPGPATVMAWAATTGLADGLLLLRSEPTIDGEPTLTYRSYGLSDERVDELTAQVVPGSGLPYVLPDPDMELIGSGIGGVGNQASQRYANATGSVTITVGDYRGQLTALAGMGGLEHVTIAGEPGYRYDKDGEIHVVWRTPTGTWATLDISATLADRVDGLIAAVAPSDDTPTTVTPTTLPTDPADTVVPAGTVYEGVVSSIIDTGSGPMLAFTLLTSLPPQGGDITLAGFDWTMVEGEETIGNTTWTGPYTVVGTWDGTTFTLTQPPSLDPPSDWPEPLTYNVVTPGCEQSTVQPLIAQLTALDAQALGIHASGDYMWDGHCGVFVDANFDTPELRAALEPLGDDVTVRFSFRLAR